MNHKSKPKRASPLDEPHLARFKALLGEMNNESPRGSVLICGAMLDDQLLECVEARLVAHPDVSKLTSGFNAPFGTFSSRIAGALALGIISSDEYHDLEIIRGIRNDFAHRLGVGFNDQSIRDRCASLRLAAQDYGMVVVGPHGRFLTAATALILNLTNRAHYVEKNRLTFEKWPY
jgi:mannitol operon repressor